MLVLNSRTGVTFWGLTAKCATEVSTRGCHRLSLESCPEPRFFPPSQSARQAVWSISPRPSWDVGDQSSSGASSKMHNKAGEGKPANQAATTQNRQENCSTATRPKDAWTSIRILSQAWRAPLQIPDCCRPASPGAAISRDRDPTLPVT
jgi:hypothetical protein